MQQFEISLSLLSKVLDEKIPFAETLRQTFQSDPSIRDLRADVAGLVGCALRHHLLFGYLLKDSGMSDEEKRVAGLVLANAYFFKHFQNSDVLAAAKDHLSEEAYAKLEPMLEKAGDPTSFIPEEVSRSSNLYLSLRYNTPEWVLKIFEHFGFGATYKTLRKITKPRHPTLRVREEKVSIESVCEDLSFVPAKTPGLVEYRGKTSLRKNEHVRKGDMFLEKEFARQLILTHLVGAPKQVFVYEGDASSQFSLDVIETYGDAIGINIGCADVQRKVEVSRLVHDKGLHNVNFFSAESKESFHAAISNPQDLVIVAPDSTDFDDISSAPDFLLRFDKESMDKLIANEASSLANASEFVEEGGLLLYVVFTISKKEGHNTVAEFLRSHGDFSLEKEKQYFPYEEEGVACYVAELRKGAKELTAPSPLQGLMDLASEQSASMAAEAK